MDEIEALRQKKREIVEGSGPERTKRLFLGNRSSRKLKFIFAHKAPYEEIIYQNDSGLAKKQFCIGIKNTWYEKLDNCSVKLEVMNLESGYWMERRLKLHSDKPSNDLSIPHKQTFPLDPGDTEIIDVAIVDETKPHSRIELCWALEGNRDTHIIQELPKGTYNLTLKGISELGRPARVRFLLHSDDNETVFKPLQEATKS